MAIIKTTTNLPPPKSDPHKWDGMPEYQHQDLTSYRKIIVHFASEDDVNQFSALIGQELGTKIKSIWYPAATIGRYRDLEYS